MTKTLITLSVDLDIYHRLKEIPNKSGFVNRILKAQFDSPDSIESLDNELKKLEDLKKILSDKMENVKKYEEEKLNNLNLAELTKQKQEEELKIKDENKYNKIKELLLSFESIDNIKSHIQDKDWLYNLRNQYFTKTKERLDGKHFNRFLEGIKVM